MVQTTAISKNSLDRLQTYQDDMLEWAKDCAFVRDHYTSELVPFVLNPGQEILHAVAEKQLAESGFVRILLLKSRRFGGSTYIEVRFYHKTSLEFNKNAFIIAHEEDSTSTLFKMAKLLHEKNPLAPSTRARNAQELIFDNKEGTGLKSEYRLATARNVHAGRSQGAHFLHDSEEAMWGNAVDLLPSLLATVPKPPVYTEVFRESTANGYGNPFQIDVFNAYAEGQYPFYTHTDGRVYAWGNPDTDWVLCFVPWYVDPHNSRPFESDGKRQEFESKIKAPALNRTTMVWEKSEALKLKEKFSLTLEQLHFRDVAIKDEFRDDANKFCQEYPSMVEEAFLSQGSNVYSKELCDILEANCKPPILTGNPVVIGKNPKVRPHEYGHFKVWRRPTKDGVYLMTVDAAGGKKKRHKEDSKEPDKTCIDVWDRESGEQCAQWHGDLDYDLIGDMVQMVGTIYNLAIACVELQNHGYTVVADLSREKYSMYEAKLGEPGWLTNSSTKPQMVDRLYSKARDGGIQIRCKETVSEMRTYKEESGQFEAETGCKDDRVVSACMGAMMMDLLLAASVTRRKDNKASAHGFSNWQARSQQIEGGGGARSVVI